MKPPTKIGKPGVNYYSLLGVPSTATQDEITKAFRKKILHVHLDKMGPNEDTDLCYLTIEAHRILSDKTLRQKYDVERSSSKSYKDSEEKFIPAGYICYDVGDQQMSRQLLDSIHGWAKEYDQAAEDLSDNYFNCFAQMMEKIMKDDNVNNEQGSDGLKKRTTKYFHCDTCDKNFVTGTQHWDNVINPYRGMFYSDRVGIAALISFFETALGPNLYNWEVRYLPSRLLGIWGSQDEWTTFRSVRKESSKILKECNFQAEASSSSRPSSSASTSSSSSSSSPSPEPTPASDVITKLEALLEKSASAKNNVSFINAKSSFLRRSLLQNLIWVLENKNETLEPMISRMNELIMQDDLQEILCLCAAMKEVRRVEISEWEQLIQDALSHENFELAMMWTMLAVLCGDKSKGDWYQLGMTIRGMGDAVLAHFCFLLSGCDTPAGWEHLADIFTQNGLHYAACEYHLNKGNLFSLLHKSRALKKIDPEASSIYSGIYYATRVKGILQILRNRSRQSSSEANGQYDSEIEELIEIIQDSGGNPLEGFRIVVSTWPDVFEEAPGYWIHRATIQFLRKGKVNLKVQKLILAACHYLPEEERQEEIGTVAEDETHLTRQMLEKASETNDFELLTDVLLHLNKRTLEIAEEYLEEIKPVLPPPPSTEEKEDENEADEMKNNEEEETIADEPNPASAPPNPPPPPTPSHKTAMVYLLSGTIYKVKECWLEAMKDYQTALLSAPEVMHRVLPCVSKLVQDIQFHEAVVSKVHQEIEDLRNHLVNEQYPNIDEFSSDKRQSLILTDVAPKMDYGYKDSVSRIQPDPEKMPPPPPPDAEQDAPPPAPANTPMVTLDKNQEAIQSGQQDGQIDQLSAGLAYVDLLKALPLEMHPGPIVMAASHFLRAMDDTPEDIGKLYAYRNAIMLMAENLLRVDKKLQHTIHHGLTHKHMLSILLSAHEKLSKALKNAKKNGKEENDDDEEESENEDDNNEADGKLKKDLIRQSDAHVISKFLQNVVNFPKVEPLANIPTLNCSDLVYVETLGNSFLSHFCADKVRQKHQSPLIPKHLHAYTHFVEVWKGRSTLSDFPQARVKAMEELVALKGWTMGDVEKNMMWPFLLLSDGFSPPLQCLLQLRDPAKSYRTIDGFHIDYEKGSVELLFSRDSMTPADTLIDHHDILDMVSMSRAGLDKMVFSLESPDSGVLTSHPFKEARISMKGQPKLSNQQKIWSQIPAYIQATLSRVSILLCYLASGFEFSSETPFWMRGTHEGLLSRLDEHLQHLARPITWRKAERRRENEKSPLGIDSEHMGKLWLNMIEVFEEIEEEEEEDFYEGSNNPIVLVHSRQLTYRVGQIRTEVRPNMLVMTIDPKQKRERLSPEAEFCRDFTKHFQDFARSYPELARLEELVKISVVCSKLRQVLKENKAMLQELNSKGGVNDLRENQATKLKAVSRVCKVIEQFLGLQSSDEQPSSRCNWFPATFCHNADPDVYDVTAGIELDPVVTYGPVSTPPKSIRVPLENFIRMKEDLVEETVEPEKQTVMTTQDHESEEEEEESDEEEGEEESVEEEEVSQEEDEDEVSEMIGEPVAKQDNGALSAVPEESEEEEEEEGECEVSEEDDGEMDEYEELEETSEIQSEKIEQEEIGDGESNDRMTKVVESKSVSELEEESEDENEESINEESESKPCKVDAIHSKEEINGFRNEEQNVTDEESDCDELLEGTDSKEGCEESEYEMSEISGKRGLQNADKDSKEAEEEEEEDDEIESDHNEELEESELDGEDVPENNEKDNNSNNEQRSNDVNGAQDDEEKVPTLTIKISKSLPEVKAENRDDEEEETDDHNKNLEAEDEEKSDESEENECETASEGSEDDDDPVPENNDSFRKTSEKVPAQDMTKRSFLSRRGKNNVVIKICANGENTKSDDDTCLKIDDGDNNNDKSISV